MRQLCRDTCRSIALAAPLIAGLDSLGFAEARSDR